MIKLEKLSKPQLDALPAYVDKWLRIGLSTDPIDVGKAMEAVARVYDAAGVPKPKNYYVFSSPYSAAVGAAMLQKMGEGAQVGDQVRDQVRDQVVDQVEGQVVDQVEDQVWAQVMNQVGDQVGDQVWDQVWAQVGGQVKDQVWAQVRAQVGDQVGDQVRDQVRDQVVDQVEGQVVDQVEDQVMGQVWDQVMGQVEDQVGAQVWNRVWNQVRDQVGAQVWDQVTGQVWNQVWRQVGDQVWDQVWRQVGAQVRDQVTGQVTGQVWDQVTGQVWNQVWRQVGDQVRDQVTGQVKTQIEDSFKRRVAQPTSVLTEGELGEQVEAMVYGCHDANWLSFYDVMADLGITEARRLKPLMDLAECCGWWAPYSKAVILQDRPCKIVFDDRNRLHCEDGPAIEYRDGFAVYSWHGTRIPGKWITSKPTPEEALGWENIEQRRAACEIVGWHNILTQLSYVLIDKDRDPQIGELLEVDIPEIGKERFLRVTCGTGREFAIPVPPDMRTALQANAWTWGLSAEQYKPEVRT